MNYLIDGPITQEIIAHLIKKMGERTDMGGHSLFLGQVRADEVNLKKVIAIEYSAYETMVKTEAEGIIKEVLSEFSDVRSINIVHSNGKVNAGEISLLVLVSAGHRHDAVQACSKTVELIKVKLPIWKKELFDDQTTGWRENNAV